MRKHKYMALFIGLLIFIMPAITLGDIFYNDTNINGLQNARGVNLLTKPLGGKVIAVGKTPAIVCAAMSGPIFIRPYNIALPGPYFIRASLSGRPKVAGYTLGLYRAVPDIGTCTNPESGVPIPAFELKPYGVSQ